MWTIAAFFYVIPNIKGAIIIHRYITGGENKRNQHLSNRKCERYTEIYHDKKKTKKKTRRGCRGSCRCRRRKCVFTLTKLKQTSQASQWPDSGGWCVPSQTSQASHWPDSGHWNERRKRRTGQILDNEMKRRKRRIGQNVDGEVYRRKCTIVHSFDLDKVLINFAEVTMNDLPIFAAINICGFSVQINLRRFNCTAFLCHVNQKH